MPPDAQNTNTIQQRYNTYIPSGVAKEGEVGGVGCPASFSSFCDLFVQNKGGLPSLDPPLDTYFIATPYKGFPFTRLHNYTTK